MFVQGGFINETPLVCVCTVTRVLDVREGYYALYVMAKVVICLFRYFDYIILSVAHENPGHVAPYVAQQWI